MFTNLFDNLLIKWITLAEIFHLQKKRKKKITINDVFYEAVNFMWDEEIEWE